MQEEVIEKQLSDFERRFKRIDNIFINSQVFSMCVESIKEGIANEFVTPAEKSTILANYFAQTTTNIINSAAQTALQLNSVSINDESTLQKAKFEIELLKEQITKNEIEKQALKSDINLKIANLHLSKINALSEAEKITSLHNTVNHNLSVKQTEFFIQFLNIILAKDYTKLENQDAYVYILNKIADLSKDKVAKYDESNLKNIIKQIMDYNDTKDYLNDKTYTFFVSKTECVLDEQIELKVLINDESKKDCKAAFYADNKLITNSSLSAFVSFNTKGKHSVKAIFENQSKELQINVI